MQRHGHTKILIGLELLQESSSDIGEALLELYWVIKFIVYYTFKFVLACLPCLFVALCFEVYNFIIFELLQEEGAAAAG